MGFYAVLILILAILVQTSIEPGQGIQWPAISEMDLVATVISPEETCDSMKRALIKNQRRFCKENSAFMKPIKLGAAVATDECQYQYRDSKWNCSTLGQGMQRQLSTFLRASGHGGLEQDGSYTFYTKKPKEMDSSNWVRNRRPQYSARGGNRIRSREMMWKVHKREKLEEDSRSHQVKHNPVTYKNKNVGGPNRKRKQQRKMSKKVVRKFLKKFSQSSPVVHEDTKEDAFVKAVFAASAAYQVTRFCTLGEHENCGCDRSLKGTSPEGFKWSGCSENVDFGIIFSRPFVDAVARRQVRKKRPKLSSLMELHNNEVGRKILKETMETKCVCHGLSGSCEIKSCFKRLAPFREVSKHLKEKSDNTVKVKQSSVRNIRKTLQSIPMNLVFSKDSPDYCDFDIKKRSLGTKGRQCNPFSKGSDSCDALCCSRGFTRRKEIKVERCNCKFMYCCSVKCEECEIEVEVSTCK